MSTETKLVKRKPGKKHALDKEGMAKLRTAAGLFYVSDRNASLAEMAKVEPWNQTHPSTLKEWSGADDWVEKRRAFWQKTADEVAEELRKRLGSSILEEQLREMQDLKSVIDDAFIKLKIEPPTVMSYEGLLNAYAKLVSLHQERLDLLGPQIPQLARPEVPAGAPPQGLDPRLAPQKYDFEEARAMAVAAIRTARERMRQKLAQGTPATPPQLSAPPGPKKKAPKKVIR